MNLAHGDLHRWLHRATTSGFHISILLATIELATLALIVGAVVGVARVYFVPVVVVLRWIHRANINSYQIPSLFFWLLIPLDAGAAACRLAGLAG